jgi:hypothetical protein
MNLVAPGCIDLYQFERAAHRERSCDYSLEAADGQRFTALSRPFAEEP